ncbi:MAG: hypothetical protein QW727_01885 [Candidatus Pacearchaeota archaeon]
MEKKGAGHVEMIISFIIFVGFLIFIFSIFNPFNTDSNVTLVDNVFTNLEENLTTKLSSVSVSLNSEKRCIILNNFKEILDDMGCPSQIDGKINVKNKNEENVRYNYDNNNKKLYLEINPPEKFFTISCSEDISTTENTIGCSESTSNYGVGIIIERKVWSKRRIEEFKRNYETDYLNLKRRIIPEGNDFGFQLWDIDNTLSPEIEAGKPPSRVRVNAKTIPIDVLEIERGDVKKRTLTIIVW